MTALRIGFVAVGTVLLGFAAFGILTDPDVRPVGVLVFLAAVLVGHDGVVLPAVLAAGALIGRFVPVGDRATVRVAAVCTGAVTVVALPLVLGYGRTRDNPSALPLAYGRGFATVVALIWAVALVAIVVRRIRKHLERTMPGADRPGDR